MSSRPKIGQVGRYFSQMPLQRINTSTATMPSIKSRPALDAARGTWHRSAESWASGPGCRSAAPGPGPASPRPAGRPVAKGDDGDQPVDVEDVAGVVAAGGRGLGGEAAALERPPEVVADLQLGHAVDLLGGQAAVADELPGRAQRQQPQPKAVVAVQPLVPADPGQRLLAGLGMGVVAHDLGVTQQCGHVVQVRGLYRPGDSGTDDQRDLAATSNGACGQPEQYRRRRGGECGMVRKEKRGST